jgi:hypothetical protein
LTPFQTHYLSENLAALEIEPGTSKSVIRNSDEENTDVAWADFFKKKGKIG